MTLDEMLYSRAENVQHILENEEQYSRETQLEALAIEIEKMREGLRETVGLKNE